MRNFKINSDYKAVVIGGSAGSFQGITKILSQIPEDFPLPIIMCLHRLKHVRNGFVEALKLKSTKDIVEPVDKESIRRGQVYLAPANYHLSIELGNYFSLSTEEMFNNSRPAIDITLGTAAYAYRHRLVGILLSGANRDGGIGMARIQQKGGLTIVQDREECMISTMPQAALDLAPMDYELKLNEIIDFLNQLHKKLNS
ncbi:MULTISPECIES: chemotaxis protein CheB [Persicobacter]|uniref:protein-glutamate methylesterase n=1 Tax=Persicobacter diffluens TaxID=981 RepID=A0AAN5AID9_9BACT|nr:chemotaxis protein CheB [Persicobacter sp. CCB-QB2]GJM60325.1 chemotaxis protein CheB [Persicobacter diffluens]